MPYPSAGLWPSPTLWPGLGVPTTSDPRNPATPNASWVFVLADPTGAALAELVTASGRKLTFKRNTAPTFECVLSLEDEAASLLWNCLTNTGIPTCRGYRNGVLRFNGYLAPFQEEAEEGGTQSLMFRGPFGRLIGDGDGSGRFTTDIVDFIQDGTQIAKSLVDTANADGATGLVTTGSMPITKVRERTYEFANVGDSIVALSSSALLDGFDFEDTPVDGGATLGQLNIYTQQGQARDDAVFEYGPGTVANVAKVSRSVSPPVNVVRILGSDGDMVEVTDAASIAKYGKWWRQESASDVAEFDVLTDKANGFLRPRPIRTVDFEPDPALSPLPWDDYWLGDTVPFRARYGAMLEEAQVRVNAIDVVVDENGDESFEIQDPTTPDEEAVIRAGLSVEIV